MSGSLVLLNEVNVTSGATVNITFSDTSFDVYVLYFNNGDDHDCKCRGPVV